MRLIYITQQKKKEIMKHNTQNNLILNGEIKKKKNGCLKCEIKKKTKKQKKNTQITKYYSNV